MQRRSKIHQIRSNQKMKSQDEFKYYEGGDDADDENKVNADAAMNAQEFEKKKQAQRDTIRKNLLKWLIVFALICYASYQIMLTQNPYKKDAVEDSTGNEESTPVTPVEAVTVDEATKESTQLEDTSKESTELEDTSNDTE